VTLNVLTQGFVFGSIYALVAFGFNLLYLPTNVFNFAQGDLVMVGGMFAAVLTVSTGGPWIAGLAVGLAVPVLLALLEERVAVTPILKLSSTSDSWVITTLAFSIIIENIVGQVWGANDRSVPAPPGLTLSTHYWYGAYVSNFDIAIVVVTLAIVVGLEWLSRSRSGRAIRAIAEDRDAALLRGIDPLKLTRIAFAIGGAIAGLAGVLVSTLLGAGVGIAAFVLLPGFEAAALGGIGNNRGALLAGWIIGLVQAVGASLWNPGYQSLASFVFLLAILLVRPRGLLGERVLREV
jgi:branched-chain amino acid transport system permease protein